MTKVGILNVKKHERQMPVNPARPSQVRYYRARRYFVRMRYNH